MANKLLAPVVGLTLASGAFWFWKQQKRAEAIENIILPMEGDDLAKLIVPRGGLVRKINAPGDVVVMEEAVQITAGPKHGGGSIIMNHRSLAGHTLRVKLRYLTPSNNVLNEGLVVFWFNDGDSVSTTRPLNRGESWQRLTWTTAPMPNTAKIEFLISPRYTSGNEPEVVYVRDISIEVI